MLTATFALALALIVAGVGVIYWPAGLIVAGLLIGAGAWLYARGEPDEDGSG